MKDAAAVSLGRRGGRAGTGKAKARSTKQARAAAMVRWANHWLSLGRLQSRNNKP